MNTEIENEVVMIESVANNLFLISEGCTDDETLMSALTGLAYTLLEQIGKIEKNYLKIEKAFRGDSEKIQEEANESKLMFSEAYKIVSSCVGENEKERLFDVIEKAYSLGQKNK